MCQFISFHHNPDNGDIAVYDLEGHALTEQKLKLNLKLWCEGHYTPDGKLELRLPPDRSYDSAECQARFTRRFPSFAKFFTWCFSQPEVLISNTLYLNGLTSAKGLVVPNGVNTLFLDGLTSAKGLVVPDGVKLLSLNGLASAKGLVVPNGVNTLFLNGLASAKGLVVPDGVKLLYLNGLTSANGLVVPDGVKLLFLDGLTSANGLVVPNSVKCLYLNARTSDERAKVERSRK